MNSPYNLDQRQHDKGWNHITGPCIRLIEQMGGTVLQVKEKFGGLRIYFTAPEESHRALDYMVTGAELDASRTCEYCGDRGDNWDLETKTFSPKPKLCRRPSGWVKTLCGACAKELGYAPTD